MFAVAVAGGAAGGRIKVGQGTVVPAREHESLEGPDGPNGTTATKCSFSETIRSRSASSVAR